MDSRFRIYDFRTKKSWLGSDCGFRIYDFPPPPREVMSLPHTLVSVPRRAQRRKYEVGGAS
eukprot:scaffold29933_cov21-Phaeocystis_antarctica.AAC.1